MPDISTQVQKPARHLAADVMLGSSEIDPQLKRAVLEPERQHLQDLLLTFGRPCTREDLLQRRSGDALCEEILHQLLVLMIG